MNNVKKIKISSLSQIAIEIEKLNITSIGTNNKKDEELYLALKVLQTDLNTLDIAFPFILEISDKPDIRIVMENCKIGIEVTFAINEVYQKAKRIRDNKNPSLILEPVLYDIGKTQQGIEMSIVKSNENLSAPAYVDDELEAHVIKSIYQTIENKIKKFLNGYEKFNKNYLIIYCDNLGIDSTKIIRSIKEDSFLMRNRQFDQIILRIQGTNYLLK
jgi:hypothetical protein